MPGSTPNSSSLVTCRLGGSSDSPSERLGTEILALGLGPTWGPLSTLGEFALLLPMKFMFESNRMRFHPLAHLLNGCNRAGP